MIGQGDSDENVRNFGIFHTSAVQDRGLTFVIPDGVFLVTHGQIFRFFASARLLNLNRKKKRL